MKKFAQKQFEEETNEVSFEHEGMCIVNPWMDPTGRFELTTMEAIREYGLKNVLKFIWKR